MDLPEQVVFGEESIPKYVEYGFLKNFQCRNVIGTNEYHIKYSGDYARLASILNGIIGEASFSILDKENLLKLEWRLAMKVDSVFANEMIETFLQKADDYLVLEKK